MSILSQCVSRGSPTISDPTGDSSAESSSLMYRNGRRLSKREKLELKRMRNRQAAKKSRKLKKDHFEDLQKQNEELRQENLRLHKQLEQLRMLTNIQKTDLPVAPILLDQPEQMIDQDLQTEVIRLNEDLNRQRKTDDDINFERITESWNHHSLLPRLFMLMVVLCMAWLVSSGDSKKFAMSGVECADLVVNSTSHALCVDMQRRSCLRDKCALPETEDEVQS